MPEFKFPVMTEDGKIKKKRGPTAYAAFQKEKRAEIKEEHPKWSEEKIRNAISEAWKEADKDEWSDKAGVKKEEKVKKRGVTGYNLFCKEERAKVVKDGVEGNAEIMKELGARWRKLEKKQEKWNEAAKLDNKNNGFSSSTSGSEKGKKQVEEEVEEEIDDQVDDEVEEDEDEKPLKKGKARKTTDEDDKPLKKGKRSHK
jgi:hypothetical protein